MGNQVYCRNEYIIIRIGDEYVVYNKRKEFSNGHSHIKNFKTAKYLIDMAISKRIPNHLSCYLLTSLIRISDDLKYQIKIQELIDVKKNKKQKYINRTA